MKHRNQLFLISILLLTLFILWTTAVIHVDVQPIGPCGSSVGFAGLNVLVHEITGVHHTLYILTDYLGLVPIFVCIGFGILGLYQWIKRRSILKVDFSILLLGGFYITVLILFVFFEQFIVNYRPVLIDGILEASYPSSTTMLVMSVMPTATMQFRSRITNQALKTAVTAVTVTFTILMVILRLISGVHWFTDIIGGALLSSGLVALYAAVLRHTQK